MENPGKLRLRDYIPMYGLMSYSARLEEIREKDPDTKISLGFACSFVTYQLMTSIGALTGLTALVDQFRS